METARVAMAVEPFAVTLTQGFQDLYERYSESVYRAALRVTGNPADAEDVLQNVFLRIFDNRLVLDPERSPEGYLRRAATNASIDLLRRKAVLPHVEMEEGRDYGAAQNRGVPQSRGVHQSPVLLKERLRRALAKIPAADAELFVLRYLEGYSYEELAGLMNLECGTVASRLHRIRAVLRKELSQ